MRLLPLLGFLIAMVFSGGLLTHWVPAYENNREKAPHPQPHEGHHHEAHHGGVLNVIGNCETGHIEIRLEDDTIEAWLVGGGHDTHRSVPVKAQEILLTLITPDKGGKKLTLKASPMRLAGEEVGHCSHFIARADWLKGMKAFEARLEIEFKGSRYKVFIRFPEGHDPSHGEAER